jgi:large subunit ribosomal protein L15
MKLHDLQPAKGAHTPRTRVGRGIAAGKGKTAGRGTKGQKSRTGGTIPPWFEGGQTPIHIRIPKLRGFRNRGKIEYEVVNLGRISQLVELGALESGDLPGGKAPKAGKAPITVNQEILRAAGLVSTLKKPLKILGQGDVSSALFVVADAFSKSAVTKIEAAGGSVQVLEVPTSPMAALTGESDDAARTPTRAQTRATAERTAKAGRLADLAETERRRIADAPSPKAKAEKPAKADAAPKQDAAPAPAAEAPAAEATTTDAPASEAPEAGMAGESPVNADAATESATTPSEAMTDETDAAPKRSRRKTSDDDGGGAA